MTQNLSVAQDALPQGANLDCDIAIIGGGVVGATLAAGLKASGLRVVVVEASSKQGAASRERAYALSPLSGRIFKGVGIWPQVFPHIGKYRHIYLSDADAPRIVKFKPADLGTDFLGYVGEHRVLMGALQEVIDQDCPNVRWLYSARVQTITRNPDATTLEIMADGELQPLRTRLVVGADGPRSQVRQWAGVKTQGWKYWQSCVTFMIGHEAPRNDIAFERFWPQGPMGVLPLPGNRCHIVWTAPHTEAEWLQSLDEDEFLARLQYYTGHRLGRLRLLSDRLVFPVQLFQSQHYVQPQLALVGDAAHRCHPVAGQGLNLGVRDAAALAQVLTEAYHRGEDVGSLRVLRRYERWRKRENLLMLGFTDFLDRMFSNTWWPVVQLRRLGLWLLRTVPPLKVFALRLMTGFVGRQPFLGKG